MNAPTRHAALPPTLAPRGLSRVEAAAYIGISAAKFDDLVADGSMPKPFSVGTRQLWDLRAVDQAFDALSGFRGEQGSVWDHLLKGERG